MRHLRLMLSCTALTPLSITSAAASTMDDVTAALTTGGWAWVVVPAATLGFAGLGWLGHRASALLTERTHASRVARLVDTLASVAAGIARTMLDHPPAPADVIEAVRQAAIAQGVAYAKAALPDTIKAIGIDDDRLAARLANEVSDAELSASRPALMAVAARGMTALADALASAQAAAAPAA